MLLSLVLKDFGIVEKAEIEFGRALNVLTGEPGSGKSIIVEALQLALGGRASVDYVRRGKERAVVQAVFDAASLPAVNSKLEEEGLVVEDGLLIMTRELSRSGRNMCRVNGQVVTLSTFKEIGRLLADLHGQHEQQSLLYGGEQLNLLDCYGGPSLLSAREEVKRIFREWQEAQGQYRNLAENSRERARMVDTLRYQIEEIDSAALRPGEIDELMAEKKLLINAEKIARLSARVYESLYAGERDVPGAVDLLESALRDLEELRVFDEKLAAAAETVRECLYRVQDVSREMAAYRDGLEFDPKRLDEVERRLGVIKQLTAKYGESIEEVLQYRDRAAAQLAHLDSSDERMEDLKAELSTLEERWRKAALELSSKRRAAARALEEAIESELRDLDMGQARFQIRFIEDVPPGPQGRERVEFLISVNPGEPLRPLARVASGGELSRVMLAVKSVLTGADGVPLLVFDEVDAGTGGRALDAVAEKLAALSRRCQVVCVTHAPQIAALAEKHFVIDKRSHDDRTTVNVRCLEGRERLEELARMLAGRGVTEAVLEHARLMLAQKTQIS